ncbi:YbaB/EbfC family nucleoid-associated protein [Nocardioides marmoriginsengisoli]|uniref:Nucleoid-associated protein EFK50_10160 n=1 Tax=Nocardioides marmoriginsengisoli TaxID=661483 RepID=A0A3N0CGL6_9ACTN|nr:YbaB/EbfC family nucleoid-associated protein [Nocardioides marmoriginsengisoli]RNL62156.1 YbaB/EbfC family nucleoid-associated protein [Nocardioides marmoriginsengisoli]
MTEQNPFGGGALDLGAMLEQAQQLQSQMMAAQEELARTLVEGTAGGVTATVTGVGDLTAVAIAPGAFDGSDPESLADLGDLVVAAYRDAKAKADTAAAAALGPLAGALGGTEPPAPLGFRPAGG